MSDAQPLTERLARLLCRFNSEHEDHWERNLPKAREILSAIRLPSADMISAGYQVIKQRPDPAWIAMVDAALRG